MKARSFEPFLELKSHSYASVDVLDLHDQDLVDCKTLSSKFPTRNQEDRHPWTIVLLYSNLIYRLEGLHLCQALRKLDLSQNSITKLPNQKFWSHLSNLEVLLLHDNKIDSIHAMQSLAVLPKLTILTCYGNPVEHHPAYRHVLVNVNVNLKLLDFYLVSDQELIEGADFGPRFGTFSKNLELVLPRYENISPQDQLRVLEYELRLVRQQHRKFSPVIKLQSICRGVLVRRSIRSYHRACLKIQTAFRRYQARKLLSREPAVFSNALARKGRAGGASGAQTLYLVDTNDLVISLFMHLVRRIEQKEQVSAPAIQKARLILLSEPSLVDDYPLVRYMSREQQTAYQQREQRIKDREKKRQKVESDDGAATNQDNGLDNDGECVDYSVSAPAQSCPFKLRFGKFCTVEERRSLRKIKRRGCRYQISSELNRRIINAMDQGPHGWFIQDKSSKKTKKKEQDGNNQENNHKDPNSNHDINNGDDEKGKSKSRRKSVRKKKKKKKKRKIYRLYRFTSPDSRFHEALIRAVHKYNIDKGNYLDSHAKRKLRKRLRRRHKERQGDIKSASQVVWESDKDDQDDTIVIYPGMTASIVAAAIRIQSVWRSYATRQRITPSIGRHILLKRTNKCIVRWWKNMLFRYRTTLLRGLKRYGDTITSRHLFMRADNYALLRRQNQFAAGACLFPEHGSVFQVVKAEDYVDMKAHVAMANCQYPLAYYTDYKSHSRPYPMPVWLARSFGGRPMLHIHEDGISPARGDQFTRDIPVALRGSQCLRKGVQVSWIRDLHTGLPDVAEPGAGSRLGTASSSVDQSNFYLDEDPETYAMKVFSSSASSSSSSSSMFGPEDGQVSRPGTSTSSSSFPPSPLIDIRAVSQNDTKISTHFVKLSFESIDEARNRALCLAIATFDPLHPDALITLMTFQHVQFCYETLKTSNAHKERQLLYTTYFAPRQIEELLRNSRHFRAVDNNQIGSGSGSGSGATGVGVGRIIGFTSESGTVFAGPNDFVDISPRPARTPTPDEAKRRRNDQQPSPLSSSSSSSSSTTKSKGKGAGKPILNPLDLQSAVAQAQRETLSSRTIRTARPGTSASATAREWISSWDDDDGEEGDGNEQGFLLTARPVGLNQRDVKTAQVEQTKQQWAQAQRLTSRRVLAEKRIAEQHKILKNKRAARESQAIHKIKMHHLSLREHQLRQQRHDSKVDYSKNIAIAKTRALTNRMNRVERIRTTHRQTRELAKIEKHIEREELRRRINAEQAAYQQALSHRDHEYERRKARNRAKRHREKQRKQRLKQERMATVGFMAQQNMITRQLHQGMMVRHKQRSTQHAKMRVNKAKHDNAIRRQEVRQILYDNFNRRRQGAMAQRIENNHNLNLRRLKDHNKLEIMRAHREHLKIVQALAAAHAHQAGKLTLRPHLKPSQQKQMDQIESQTGTSTSLLGDAFGLGSSPLGFTQSDIELNEQIKILSDLAEQVKGQYMDLVHDGKDNNRKNSNRELNAFNTFTDKKDNEGKYDNVSKNDKDTSPRISTTHVNAEFDSTMMRLANDHTATATGAPSRVDDNGGW